MAVSRLSKSFISGGGDAGPKSSSFLASYSPAIDEMDLIQRVTVGAGGAANINFTSIPQTYRHLQIKMIFRSSRAAPATQDAVRVQFNGITSASYSSHGLYYSSGSSGAEGYANNTFIYGNNGPTSNISASVFGVNICSVLDYTDIIKNKTFICLGTTDTNATTGEIIVRTGSILLTNAVTSINLYLGVGNFVENTVASLYGVVS